MATFEEIAKVELLPESDTQTKITPTQIVLHTAVDVPGETDLHNYFNLPGIGTESHFFIQKDGDIFQYMDTTTRADANFDANRRAISVETEDDGSVAPWTVEQIKAIKRLGDALMLEHPGILRRVAPQHDLPGWGYHSLFQQWNQNNHACPGPPRIHQFETDITTWLRNPPLNEEVDQLPYSKVEIQDMLRGVLNEGTPEGQPNWARGNRALFAMAQDTYADVNKIVASGVAAKIDVDALAEAIATRLDPENVSQATVEAAIKAVLGSLDESA